MTQPTKSEWHSKHKLEVGKLSGCWCCYFLCYTFCFLHIYCVWIGVRWWRTGTIVVKLLLVTLYLSFSSYFSSKCFFHFFCWTIVFNIVSLVDWVSKSEIEWMRCCFQSMLSSTNTTSIFFRRFFRPNFFLTLLTVEGVLLVSALHGCLLLLS